MTSRNNRLVDRERPNPLPTGTRADFREPLVTPEAMVNGRDSKAVTSLACLVLRMAAGKTTDKSGIPPKLSEQCRKAFCSILLSGGMRDALGFPHLFVAPGATYGDIAEDLFSAAARRQCGAHRRFSVRSSVSCIPSGWRSGHSVFAGTVGE